MKKGTTVQMNADAIKNCRKFGIMSHCAFMIGIPTETIEDLNETLKFVKINKPDLGGAAIYHPFPKTKLGEYCIEKGFLSQDDQSGNPMRQSVLRMPHFPPEQIKGLVRTFPLYVKMPKSYFETIRIAEQLNEEGDSAFAELRDVYFKEYFK